MTSPEGSNRSVSEILAELQRLGVSDEEVAAYLEQAQAERAANEARDSAASSQDPVTAISERLDKLQKSVDAIAEKLDRE